MDERIILNNPMGINDLNKVAEDIFGDMVKAVVDINLERVAINAELHSDLEQELLRNGSEQKDLWGINLYPENFGTEDFIEFDSLINIRPWQGNRSRYVEDEPTRIRVADVVKKYFEE